MLKGEDQATGWTRSRYSDDFAIGTRLMQFAKVMLPEGHINYAGDNGMAVVTSVFALMGMGLKVFRGIHHLAANCLTEPSLMLLRPLSEVLASLGYIAANPSKTGQRAEMYLSGEVVEHYRWVKKLVKEGVTEHLSAETLAKPEKILDTLKQRLTEDELQKEGPEGAEARAEARLRQMCSQQGWADVSVENMLEEAEAKLAYPLVFKWAAGILHARMPGMYVDIDDAGNIIRNFGVDPKNLGIALGYGNLLFAALIRSVNDIFKLGLAVSVSAFMDEISENAKKKSKGTC